MPSPPQAIETIIALGPFMHCLLMPCFWYRTHRRKSKVVPEEPPKTPELDPEANTVIFYADTCTPQGCCGVRTGHNGLEP